MRVAQHHIHFESKLSMRLCHSTRLAFLHQASITDLSSLEPRLRKRDQTPCKRVDPCTARFCRSTAQGSRMALVHAASATLEPAQRPSAIPHLEGKVRYIGLGSRGAKILSQLMQSLSLEQSHCWYIDSEDKGAWLGGTANRVILEEHQSSIPHTQLEKMIGGGAHDQQGKGNINTGDGGIAFIVASAESIPSSNGVLLSLVKSLRAAGFFTAVALSSPFRFEGVRRFQAAEQLIQTVQDTAHLVSVVQQETLIGLRTNDSLGSPVTVDEAVSISNNAMENTVRCILAAVQAPEVLDSSKGALIWHGSEMRRFRRLLSPPLQHLLTRTSHATLGRGAACMTQELASSMGSCQALMHLATDAVQAAIESPFLEDLAGQATGALCSVSLPPAVPGGAAASGVDHAAARLAVQAAAGALMQMTTCTDIVMWYDTLHQDSQAQLQGGGHAPAFGLEVSLLMLSPRSSGKPGRDGIEKSDQSTSGTDVAVDPTSERQNATKGPKKHSESGKKKLPKSNWRLLSAMAGGSATATKQAANPVKGGSEPPSIDSQAVQGVLTVSAEPVQKVPSVGDQLAETFVAQSLDLPPKAAKWRQEQRARQEQPRLMVQAPEAAWQSQEEDEDGLTTKLRTMLGGTQQAFDVRERTYAILERDRGDAWESEGFS